MTGEYNNFAQKMNWVPHKMSSLSAVIRICVFLIGVRIAAAQSYNEEDRVSYCAPYNGKVCKSFISGRQVWYSADDQSGGWENEQIASGLWDELINELSGLCRFAAEVNNFSFIYCYRHESFCFTNLSFYYTCHQINSAINITIYH